MGRIAGVTPEETKERLIEAAVRVFELKGFEGATVSEIAREAGMTSGAIYAHYATRAELLVDALDRNRDRATAALFPPGTRVDAATVLVTLGTRLADQDRSGSDLLVEALLASRRDAELAQVLADAIAERESRTTAVVVDGQAAGVLTDDVAADVTARFALMLGLGSVLVRDLELPAVDTAEWATLIRRIVGSLTQEEQP